MKLSSMSFVAAVAVSAVLCGCRYDKADQNGDKDDAGAVVTGTEGLDLDSQTDLDSLQDGKLSDLEMAGKSFRDRGYALCTDVSFQPVYFGFDMTSIKPAELSKIDLVCEHLRANPDRVVSIEGNCDERGASEYNVSLGEDRAIVICNYMADNGIARDRMETISRGETNPAVEGSGESVWAQNRRGEFVIWKK